MAQRDSVPSVHRPTERCLCIIMACTDISEAEAVSRQLQELNNGCLVTYRRAEHILYSAPTGKVALIILATADSPAVVGRTLKWLRCRWPSCPITVVGDAGGGELEITARKGAACYLTRPVSPEQWRAVLAHALGGDRLAEEASGQELPADRQRGRLGGRHLKSREV